MAKSDEEGFVLPEMMKETAQGLHDFYEGLIEVGFTQKQALELVKALLSGATRR